MLFYDTDFDPIEELVIEVLHRPFVASGKTQKEEDLIVVRRQEFFNAVSTAISLLLTQKRALRYNAVLEDTHGVPAVDSHDIQELLKSGREGFAHFSADQREERTEWRNNLVGALYGLILHQGLEEDEVRRHRAAVEAGNEAPTDEDREWIEAKLQEASETVNRLSKHL